MYQPLDISKNNLLDNFNQNNSQDNINQNKKNKNKNENENENENENNLDDFDKNISITDGGTIETDDIFTKDEFKQINNTGNIISIIKYIFIIYSLYLQYICFDGNYFLSSIELIFSLFFPTIYIPIKLFLCNKILLNNCILISSNLIIKLITILIIIILYIIYYLNN